MVTIVRALSQLKDIEMMSVEDAEFVGEMRRRPMEQLTFDDVRRIQNLWNKFVEPVKR